MMHSSSLQAEERRRMLVTNGGKMKMGRPIRPICRRSLWTTPYQKLKPIPSYVSLPSTDEFKTHSSSGVFGQGGGHIHIKDTGSPPTGYRGRAPVGAAASIWFEIWRVVDPGQQNFDFSNKFLRNFDFFRAISQKNSIFPGKL